MYQARRMMYMEKQIKTKESVLFYVKLPENGKTKTRLAKDIGDEHAVELYKCFILDMIETLSEIPPTVAVCYTPNHAGSYFREWLGEEYVYFPQQGRDLGERMRDSFQQAFRQGFEKAVVIGSDLPDLPAHILMKAFEDLDSFDTVIGPAVDGGYYLLGFRHDTFSPGVFEDINWSTTSVFDQTLKKIQQAELTFSILPEWHDIDNLSELRQLYNQHQQTERKLTNTMSYLHKMKEVMSRKRFV